MDKLRLRFAKTGRAVYISHLDLMRTMQRAFLRSGYPLKYSEGFNPHALISILLPLSVGTESVCELMDFTLAEETDLSALPAALTRAMPEGITALEAYAAARKGRELKWLAVEGRLEYDGRSPAELSALAQELTALFSRESLVIRRKTKRGEGETDIVPAIRSLSLCPERDHVRLAAVISAQEPTLNPDHLTAAIRQLLPQAAPDFARYTRLETYGADMELFR